MSSRFPFHIWCLGIWDTYYKYKDQTRHNRFSGFQVVRQSGGGGQSSPLSGGEAPELIQIQQNFWMGFLHICHYYIWLANTNIRRQAIT